MPRSRRRGRARSAGWRSRSSGRRSAPQPRRACAGRPARLGGSRSGLRGRPPRQMSLRLSRLSLLARFGVLSIAALALLAGVLGFMLKRQIEARAMSEAEEVAVLIARAGVQPNLTPIDLRGELSSERLAQLDRRMQVGVFADTGIQRVKIFNATPEIVYSDKHDIIGDNAAGSGNVERALHGETVSHFVHGVDHTDKGARSLEVYVPLRFGAGQAAPVGVYEVYLSYTATEDAIAAH